MNTRFDKIKIFIALPDSDGDSIFTCRPLPGWYGVAQTVSISEELARLTISEGQSDAAKMVIRSYNGNNSHIHLVFSEAGECVTIQNPTSEGAGAILFDEQVAMILQCDDETFTLWHVEDDALFSPVVRMDISLANGMDEHTWEGLIRAI